MDLPHKTISVSKQAQTVAGARHVGRPRVLQANAPWPYQLRWPRSRVDHGQHSGLPVGLEALAEWAQVWMARARRVSTAVSIGRELRST